MNAVIAIETSLGRFPSGVSADKKGYDAKARTRQDKRYPNGAIVRLIDVKNRAKGINITTLTKK